MEWSGVEWSVTHLEKGWVVARLLILDNCLWCKVGESREAPPSRRVVNSADAEARYELAGERILSRQPLRAFRLDWGYGETLRVTVSVPNTYKF